MRTQPNFRLVFKTTIFLLLITLGAIAFSGNGSAAPIVDSPLNGTWVGRDMRGTAVSLSFTPMDDVGGVVGPGTYVLSSNGERCQYLFWINFQTATGQIVFYSPNSDTIVADVQFTAANQMVVYWSWGLKTMFVRS